MTSAQRSGNGQGVWKRKQIERLETWKMLTLSQAAKECGVSKGTLSKAVKSGRLSVADRSPSGFKIDPAELFRAFPKQTETPLQGNKLNKSKQATETDVYAEMAHELGQVRAERDALDRQIALMREMVDSANSNAEGWRKQAETLALSHKKGADDTGLLERIGRAFRRSA